MFEIKQMPNGLLGYYNVLFTGKVDYQDLVNYKIGVVWNHSFLMTQSMLMLTIVDLLAIVGLMEKIK